MLEGQYQDPVRIVRFNTTEKWSQDVSADVTPESLQRCDPQMRDVPFFLQALSIDTKADITACSYHCQCGLCDPWLPARPVPKRPTPASSNRHSQPRSTGYRAASAGCTKSNSTGIESSSISLITSLRSVLALAGRLASPETTHPPAFCQNGSTAAAKLYPNPRSVRIIFGALGSASSLRRNRIT
jgi:hypothetical protein